MTHLLLHVVGELDVCGLVHNQWMYLVEHMMKVLKGYVHSMARLEGSMAEGYMVEETLGFIIEYLHEFEHVCKRIWDAKEKEGVFGEVLESIFTKVVFNAILRDVAHECMLTNIEIMCPWIQ
jgi:hypothetical protein